MSGGSTFLMQYALAKGIIYYACVAKVAHVWINQVSGKFGVPLRVSN